MNLHAAIQGWIEAGRPVGFDPSRDGSKIAWGYLKDVGERGIRVQHISPFGALEEEAFHPFSKICSFDAEPVYAERLTRLAEFRATMSDHDGFEIGRFQVRGMLQEALATGEVISVQIRAEERTFIVRVIALSRSWVEFAEYDLLLRELSPILYRLSMVRGVRWRTDNEEADDFLVRRNSKQIVLAKGEVDLKAILSAWMALGQPIGFSPWENGDGTVWGYITKVSSRWFSVKTVSPLGTVGEEESYLYSRTTFFDSDAIYAERLVRLAAFRPALPDSLSFSKTRQAVREGFEWSLSESEPVRIRIRGESVSVTVKVLWLEGEWVGFEEFDDLMGFWRTIIYRISMVREVLWNVATLEAESFLIRERQSA